jgi:hypothetical protein
MESIAQNGTITIVGGVSGFNGGIPAVEIIKKTPLIRGVLLGTFLFFPPFFFLVVFCSKIQINCQIKEIDKCLKEWLML